MGDQQSDLDGGYAERTFKLPNPVYHSRDVRERKTTKNTNDHEKHEGLFSISAPFGFFVVIGVLRVLWSSRAAGKIRGRGSPPGGGWRHEGRLREVEEVEHRVGVRVAVGERGQVEARLDEAQDRGVVGDGVRHVVLAREGRDDHDRYADAVAVEGAATSPA